MQISFNQRGQRICVFVKFKRCGPFFFSANSCKNVALYFPPSTYFMHQFDFPCNFCQSVFQIAIQNNMHCWWIEIKESPKYKLHENIWDLSKTTFLYHNNDTKRNRWVILCSHCPISHSFSCLHITVYLAVMLQASWHTAEGN